jgi:hypothetical protein
MDTVFDANNFAQSLKERSEKEGLPYEVIILILITIKKVMMLMILKKKKLTLI